MRKRLPMFLAAALCSSAAWAQPFQNTDMFLSMGPVWSKSRVLAGTNVTVAGSTGFSQQFNYGYQIARASAANLMLDVSMAFGFPGSPKGSVPGTAYGSFMPVTAGLRFMVPVHSRLSFYPVVGGGFGSFRAAVVSVEDSPKLSSYTTFHGVFSFGGGGDIRLTRRFSLRGELRDVVTAKGLSGSGGRHHLLPVFGVAFHN